jgi:hypothetical protein
MTTLLSYDDTLAAARKAGASNATDAGVMALFCADTLQIAVGAVAPRLVFEGAQKTGLTALDLARLASSDPMSVSDLMWV